MTSASFCPKRRFRFELFWTKLEGFDEAVREAWTCSDDMVDPYKRLDALLRNTTSYLQARGQKKVGNVKLLMRVANWVIHKLDIAQERRMLGSEELWLRRSLKQALLGLAALERTIDRQRSRMKWLKQGDANTKLFQAFANGRRAKNFIMHIKREGVTITDQEQKEEAFFQAYERIIGQDMATEHTLDLQFLQVQSHDLRELENIITEEEVWEVIKELPPIVPLDLRDTLRLSINGHGQS
ncbi:uncharacterized protein [Aegilops tauschii subsp. strangulata]|uniref:uncharacterized protein n=1 Tax=Aegilops tauschii subsp. strangulata TaxID=200361 RepID=UPI003CC85967